MAGTVDFAKLLEPGLRTVWGLDIRQWAEEYSQIFNVETSKKAFEEDQALIGLGYVPKKSEGKSIEWDEIYQGNTKRYTQTVYGLGFKVTREMFDDDLYRKMKSYPMALSRSVRATVEQDTQNVLNRAFNSSYTGADGKELVTTDHPIMGGTISNKLATPADLDPTSFESMLILIGAFTDERGLPMATKGVRLIAHPNDDWQAKKILGSAQEPDTANNAINPGKGVLPKGHIVMHWLTDPDAWFIQTDQPNGLNFFWNRRPEFVKDNDTDSDVAKFKSTYRCSRGWTDPLCIAGSPGA